MFEVGTAYEFTLLEVGEEGPSEVTMIWTVHKVEGPVLHLRNQALAEDGIFPAIPERNMVLNTGSLFFHFARPIEEVRAERRGVQG